MKCPQCQHETPDDSKFCKDCGHALANSAYQKKNLAEVICERKQVTILFSDMAGYTAMNERLDPEEVKGIMSRVFGQITQVIAKYDGFIERFVGDAVMAIFGIPQVHEDDPVRAVRAAIEIHALAEALSPELEPMVGRPIAMHSGVNTGLVVTGEVNFEKGTHGLAGDAINLAARLQGLAGTGEIIVGESTYKLVQRHFDFETLPSTKVKGKAEHVPVFKLVSAKTPRLNIDRQVFSAMVGRDQELAKLELQVMKVINGEGSVVNVVGEAGIGKSRLLAELKKREVMQRVNLLEGRCISIGKNLSFHPIIDLLKHWARITEDDSEMQAFDKLELAIRTVHPQEADEILPFVAILMGLKLRGRHEDRVQGIEGEALEKLILKNFRDLLIKGCELQSMVIVMEDMHWADNSSLEFLQSLYGLTEKNRLLFVNVFRPGYLEEDGAKTTSVAQEKIELQPLANQDSEALINNMLEIEGLLVSIKEQILVRAGGNPFFIEEVVRSLIDDGAVVMGANGFEVTDKIERVVIPPTINEVLMARIDRLEEQTRELVKVASVIGRSFFDRILKDVADSIDGVDERLSYLKDVQLIRERKRLQELEYLFSHALAQEAAYESTLIQQRKVLHLKVAQSIERIFKGRLHEFYGMLGYHYGKADDFEKAEEFMTKAGEEALSSSASREALIYFQEALRLYLDKFNNAADPEKIANFEKNIGIALYNKAEWAEAVKYLDRVLKRWRTPLPSVSLLGGLQMISNLLGVLKTLFIPSHRIAPEPNERNKVVFDLSYKIVSGLTYVDNVRQFFVAMKVLRWTTKFEIAKIPSGVAWWMAGSGMFSFGGISFSLSERCLTYSRRAGKNDSAPEGIAFTCMNIVQQHCSGDWKKIQNFDQELVDLGLREGDLWHSTTYLWFHGLVKAEEGYFDHLAEVIKRLFQIAEDYDYDLAISYGRSLRSDYLVRKRNLREAFTGSEELVLYRSERNTELQILMFMGFKAEAQLLLGDIIGAKETISEGYAVFHKYRFIAPLISAPFLLACFLVDVIQLMPPSGSRPNSEMVSKRKMAFKSGKAALRNSRKYAPYRTKIYRLMGDYHWLIGKQRKALKWWDSAIREGERLGARPDLSRTYFEVGKRLMEPGSKHKKLNCIDARGYLEMAKGLFKEMDLQRDLDELYKIMPQAQGVGSQ